MGGKQRPLGTPERIICLRSAPIRRAGRESRRHGVRVVLLRRPGTHRHADAFEQAFTRGAVLGLHRHALVDHGVEARERGGIGPAGELALVDAALAALDAAATDNGAPWTIYSSSSSSNNAGSFSVGVADETTAPDGTSNVSLSLSAFSFSGTETNERFLWVSYSSTSLTIKDGATTVVLNDDLWNTPGVGDAITAQMKANSAGYIANLPPLKPKK